MKNPIIESVCDPEISQLINDSIEYYTAKAESKELTPSEAITCAVNVAVCFALAKYGVLKTPDKE